MEEIRTLPFLLVGGASVERQEVLDAIVQRIDGSGGALVRSVKDLAEEISVGSQRLYYLLKSFDQKGQLVTRNRGPKGLEIRLGTDERVTAKRPRPARRPRPDPQAAPDGKLFCPWCGQSVQATWRFCVRCGGELPQADGATD